MLPFDQIGDDEVISEDEWIKQTKDKAPVETNKVGDKDDRILSTSIKISPYGMAILDYLADIYEVSKAILMLRIVSSQSTAFASQFYETYQDALTSSRDLKLANVLDIDGVFEQPVCLRIFADKRKSKLTVMIPSSAKTLIETYSQGMYVDASSMVEFMVYSYISGIDEGNDSLIKIQANCQIKMDEFICAISENISQVYGHNKADENNQMVFALKMLRHGKTKATKYHTLPDGRKAICKVEIIK